MTKRNLLAALLVAITVPMSISVSAQQQTREKATIQQKKGSGITGLSSMTTDGNNNSQIDYSDNDHRYKIKLDGKKIIELYVDGKVIPEEEYSKYEPMVNKLLLQIEKDRKQAEQDRARAEEDRKQADADRQHAEKDRERAEEDRARAEEDRKQADVDRQQADKDREQAEKDREQADKDRARSEADREQVNKDRGRSQEDRLRADKDRAQAAKDRDQAELDRKQAEKDRARAEIDRKHAEEDRKLIDDLFEAVVKNNIAENRDAIKSLVLDETSFTVNGVKQSDQLQKGFSSKYLKGKGRRISFSNQGSFKGVSIDK